MWRKDDPSGHESAKIRWELPRYTRGRGLDLGCGSEKAFPHFIGVDNGDHEGKFVNFGMAADIRVATCEKLEIFASASMDFVFSSHLIEHIQDTKAALKEWWRLVRPGGYMILYYPHKELYPNIGTDGANPTHVHDFMPEDIVAIMKEVGYWDLVRNEARSAGREYSAFQVFHKASDRKHAFSCDKPKPEKTCGIVRYGALGDMIIMSSILPWLKEQGYHITLYCSQYGYDVVKHDPHIDDFYIQDPDQVPQEWLGEFWKYEGIASKKFDKFINLSESIETYLLPDQDRIQFHWPDSMRRAVMGRNYLEVTHAIAEVPFPSRQKFYSTLDEVAWARQERMKHRGRVVLWSLSGSSVHKTWPHMDAIIARLMLHDKSTEVVLVGNTMDSLLQKGWEDEKRVYLKAGEWSVRQSMAFAATVDLVVGSETGLLNAVGCIDVPKVVMLSHSTEENLTKHWHNTIAMVPTVPCYPCHRLHHSFDYCHQDQATGSALCQAQIGVEEVWAAVQQQLFGQRRQEAA